MFGTRRRISVPTWFVIATVPCAVFGVWNTGHNLSAENADVLSAWIAGAGAFVPSLLVATLTSLSWGLLFSFSRRRPLDPGWFVTPWLFVLLVPPSVPLIGIVAGVSFGVVLGQYVFGGTGKYLVSPALLGAVFLQLGYPAWFDSVAWLPGDAEWRDLFFGFQPGAHGATSEVLSLLGAGLLISSGSASWRVMVGALAASLATVLLLQDFLPWREHLVVGQFAFCVAFIATDPSAAAVTRPGRWIYGGIIGALTILFRVADPMHPEGSLLACLVGALFAPLIDALVVRWQIMRYRRAMP